MAPYLTDEVKRLLVERTRASERLTKRIDRTVVALVKGVRTKRV